VTVLVDGDGDTDLDFLIEDSNGRVIHANDDETDWTEGYIYNPYGCEIYHLYVENLGDFFNDVTVTLTGA
jgi:hypothetical protein